MRPFLPAPGCVSGAILWRSNCAARLMGRGAQTAHAPEDARASLPPPEQTEIVAAIDLAYKYHSKMGHERKI